jgi:gamma-glutamyltranspeptidase/glutathione hydrolase
MFGSDQDAVRPAFGPAAGQPADPAWREGDEGVTDTRRPELAGTFGMVSSTHWLASSTAMAMLEAGGNAFDAAVAAGFTLQVVQPHLNGPGGDLPVIFARADEQLPTVLCAQGPAPAGATSAHFAELGLGLIPGSGPLAATVPGATLGWLTLLRDHGTLDLRAVLGPAISYARDGFPLVGDSVGQAIATVEELFRTDWTTSAAVYLPGDRVPRAGELFRNPAQAATYERLVAASEAGGSRESRLDNAIAAWTEGFVAQAIDAFCPLPWRDSSGERHAGVLTGEDMAQWRPTYEQPAHLDVHGVTVCKTAAWGQGPVLLQSLALLEGLALRPGTADFVHLVVEAEKLAFADREAWYGDVPDVPMTELLSAAYNAQRRALITDGASLDLRPGSPAGRTPRLPSFVGSASGAAGAESGIGEPVTTSDGVRRGDTVHVDVVDRWGNIVAAMPSGGWLQSSPVIPELGFGLGTRLQMAWLEPGLPNSLAPRKRPRTTLSPTLVMRDGIAVLACGSPGGDQQDQWQLVFLLHHLLGGSDLQESIEAPSFHTTHFPSSFYPRASEPGHLVVEDRLGDDVIDELTRRGHVVRRAGPWSLGRMCAVSRAPASGVLKAAANPRGGLGYAVGR